MARSFSPKEKRTKRLGLKEGISRTSRKISDYGIRLREKQKAKFLYGVLEKQFRKYFTEAEKNRANTGLILMQMLERRLDNVVYRLGFAKSRNQARQMVGHGHVLVNGKKVDIPSYCVKVNDLIELDKKTQKSPEVFSAIEGKDLSPSSWLTREGTIGKIVALPQKGEVELAIDENLIIEYYSR